MIFVSTIYVYRTQQWQRPPEQGGHLRPIAKHTLEMLSHFMRRFHPSEHRVFAAPFTRVPSKDKSTDLSEKFVHVIRISYRQVSSTISEY
eukprot:5443954-Amphidinium_carterae.1